MQLGITMNALGIRALRIRDTLTTCVKAAGPKRDASEIAMPEVKPFEPDRAHLVRYLLDLLPEDEAERLDLASIVDDDVASRLCLVESDLVDDYVTGSADRRDAAAVRDHTTCPPRAVATT